MSRIVRSAASASRVRDQHSANLWVADKFRQRQGWQTVRNAWVLLSGILETAVEYGYLSTNPARGVKFPQKELKEAPAIVAGPAFAKLREALDEPARTTVSLIAATGLRIGELLALRSRALDLQIGTLAVRESVYEGLFQGPKTQKALRTIPLGPNAIAAFIAQRRSAARVQAAAQCVAAGRRKGRARTSDVTPVPPHSLVAAE